MQGFWIISTAKFVQKERSGKAGSIFPPKCTIRLNPTKIRVCPSSRLCNYQEWSIKPRKKLSLILQMGCQSLQKTCHLLENDDLNQMTTRHWASSQWFLTSCKKTFSQNPTAISRNPTGEQSDVKQRIVESCAGESVKLTMEPLVSVKGTWWTTCECYWGDQISHSWFPIWWS